MPPFPLLHKILHMHVHYTSHHITITYLDIVTGSVARVQVRSPVRPTLWADTSAAAEGVTFWDADTHDRERPTVTIHGKC